MSVFRKMRIQISLVIYPKYLSDPVSYTIKALSKKLFQYSEAIGGIPISFSIEGITPHGQILADGSIYIYVLLMMTVVKIKPGDIIDIEDNVFLNVFQCSVGDNEEFSGKCKILKIITGDKIVCSEDINDDF